jgi:polysaccharide export outer membrane protein
MMHGWRKRSGSDTGTAILVTILMILSSSAPAGSASPPAYVLGPGDLLEIAVWGYPDLTRQVAVAPDGTIMLPLVGAISTARTSVERVTELITKAYGQYLNDPHVMVTIKEYRKIHASVLGQVTKPGAYDLPLGTRLLDLVAAGGGTTDVAALKQAQFLRPGQPPVVVDLTKAMAGDAASNVPLAGGETLVVPEDLTSYVTVQGQVTHPGRYHLKGELRVLDALAMAGGLTDKASVVKASLTRAGKTEAAASAAAAPASTGPTTELLGLDGLLLRQEMDRNVILQPGDLVTVPEDTTSKIYIIGDVKSPGVFPLKTDVTLLQAIAMAGGPEQRGFATAKSAYIIRRSGIGPQQEMTAGPARSSALPNGGTLITADLGAIMKDPTRDVTVQPGDVLVLPMSSLGALQVIMNIISGIGYLFRL